MQLDGKPTLAITVRPNSGSADLAYTEGIKSKRIIEASQPLSTASKPIQRQKFRLTALYWFGKPTFIDWQMAHSI